MSTNPSATLQNLLESLPRKLEADMTAGVGVLLTVILLCATVVCLVFFLSRMEKIKLKQKGQPEQAAITLDTKGPGLKSDAEQKGNQIHVSGLY